MNTEARQVLAELELLSHGSVARWNASGGGSEAVMPPGESRPPHLYWAELFARCEIDKLPALIVQARQELESLRKRIAPATASVSIDVLIVEKAGQGWDAEAVAQHFGVAAPFVRRLWDKAGLDPVSGNQRKAIEMSTPERRRVVRQLRDRGLTQPQIAARLGCHQSTVARDLANEAG